MSEIKLNYESLRRYTKSIDERYHAEEDFAALLADSADSGLVEGSVVSGIVRSVNKYHVLVCVEGKSEGKIPVKEFAQDLIEGKPVQEVLPIGSNVNVFVEKIEGRDGTIVLSREKAVKYEVWDRLEEAYSKNYDVEGVIVSSIRSGCVVDLGKVVAFLPNSHIDLKPVRDVRSLIGKKFKFRVLKMDKKQGNIVVSRRAVLNSFYAEARSEYLSSLEVGQVIDGVVKSITNYGIFVEIHDSPEVGSMDGLVHITDMSWGRVNHPSTFYSTGQKVTVKVIAVDVQNSRVSLGIKQFTENPWSNVESDYPVGQTFSGQITSVEEYGIFVELSPGIEGLVHLSEISWFKGYKPFSRGQKVDVVVLSIDTEKSRMALSIKRATKNPWQCFVEKYHLGSIIDCKVKMISDQNLAVSFFDEEFSGLEGSIKPVDAIDDTHPSISSYKIGEKISAKVISANSSRGLIHLGIRQLTYDSFEQFLSSISVGDIIRAIIVKIEGNGIYVRVSDGVEIFIERESLPELISLSIGHEKSFKVTAKHNYSLDLSLDVSQSGVSGENE